IRPAMSPTLLALGECAFDTIAFSEMYALPMIVRLPHSLADSRHVPVLGLPPTHVTTSAVEVMITGFAAVPLTKICAPRQIARLPRSPGKLAITTPASIVSVAPLVK